jgi:redox-sensitive bicupin YhaK (pirin superfamily)
MVNDGEAEHHDSNGNEGATARGTRSGGRLRAASSMRSILAKLWREPFRVAQLWVSLPAKAMMPPDNQDIHFAHIAWRQTNK